MPTNLHIDDRLLAEAQRLGKFKTKRETVEAALAEFVKRQRQLGILAMEGTIEYRADYDYKAWRRGPKRRR